MIYYVKIEAVLDSEDAEKLLRNVEGSGTGRLFEAINAEIDQLPFSASVSDIEIEEEEADV